MTQVNRFAKALKIANEKFDGHLTIMKFTTNWRVTFGTFGERFEIGAMPEGKFLDDALDKLFELFESLDSDARKFWDYMRQESEYQENEFDRSLMSQPPKGE